ncbi:membrane-associated transporter protein-like [Anopheles nili]|uniref:membrane-associated transporter protein-like n=1 Tax=Anopheles nili TaxID=185578 RepID=UPI00237B1807|nr:membrane-associated transporter protein-like [Anopheles nili]
MSSYGSFETDQNATQAKSGGPARHPQPGTSNSSSKGSYLKTQGQNSLTMVAGGVTNFHSEFRNDPVVKEMRQLREENARRQKHDYSHVFRNKSRFDFIRISAVIMGMEFVYSAETAFVSPILLGIGIEHHLMTMVWGISPLIGFFMSPVIGSISDRCRSRFGRRRPVLLVLGLGLITGCLLVPNGKEIGSWFGDLGETIPGTVIEPATALLIDLNGTISSDAFHAYNFYKIESEIAEHRPDYRWAIVITIIGTIMTDFNADNCMTPSRAFLLDISLPEDHGRACSTFSILAGMGGSIGYAMGGINWDETSFGELLGGSIRTVFTMVSVIFAICLTISLTSFREIPLPLLEQDDLLRPLTETIIKKEKARRQNQIFVVKGVSKALTAQLQSIQTPEDGATQKINNALVDVERAPRPKDGTEEEEEEEEHFEMGPKDFIKSIVMMPKSIAILCLTNLLCWMSHLSYSLYFTDFVGEEVFRGDPAAPTYSDEYKLFLEGVRYACFGMAIYSISCSTCSFTIEKLIKVLRARTVYCGGLIIDAIGMACMAFFPNKVTVYVLSATGGIVYALLFTMPFLLIGQYHAKGTFKVTKPGAEAKQERKRGLATDIAVVGGMIFIAQIIVAVGMGSLITYFGTTAVVVYSASICSLLASVSASQVVYMDL